MAQGSKIEIIYNFAGTGRLAKVKKNKQKKKGKRSRMQKQSEDAISV